jgi:hypothetical protein
MKGGGQPTAHVAIWRLLAAHILIIPDEVRYVKTEIKILAKKICRILRRGLRHIYRYAYQIYLANL